MSDRTEQTTEQQKMGLVIAKAWADEVFKAALLANPAATLTAEGITVPEGMTLEIVENTDTLLHIILPPRPPERELSDDALEDAIND